MMWKESDGVSIRRKVQRGEIETWFSFADFASAIEWVEKDLGSCGNGVCFVCARITTGVSLALASHCRFLFVSNLRILVPSTNQNFKS